MKGSLRCISKGYKKGCAAVSGRYKSTPVPGCPFANLVTNEIKSRDGIPDKLDTIRSPFCREPCDDRWRCCAAHHFMGDDPAPFGCYTVMAYKAQFQIIEFAVFDRLDSDQKGIGRLRRHGKPFAGSTLQAISDLDAFGGIEDIGGRGMKLDQYSWQCPPVRTTDQNTFIRNNCPDVRNRRAGEFDLGGFCNIAFKIRDQSLIGLMDIRCCGDQDQFGA